MHHKTRRSLLRGMLVGTGVALTTASASARRQDVQVPVAPPPPRPEAIPVLAPEKTGVEQWQAGHWRWNGHEHVWLEGRYVARPRLQADWVPGRWEERPRGWIYIEGHWN